MIEDFCRLPSPFQSNSQRSSQPNIRSPLPVLFYQQGYKVLSKARYKSPKPVSPQEKKEFAFFKPFTKAFEPTNDQEDDSLFVMKKILVPRGNRFRKDLSDDSKRQDAMYKEMKTQQSLKERRNFQLQCMHESLYEDKKNKCQLMVINQTQGQFKLFHSKDYDSFIQQMSTDTQHLDISDLKLNKRIIDSLRDHISAGNIKITRIVAIRGNLGNDLSYYLTSSLNHSLRYLDLSMNKICNEGIIQIAQLLPFLNLVEFYLHWNLITSVGGVVLIQEIVKCQQLKVLDLSCNHIGNTNTNEFVKILKHYLSQNIESIVHLDLGFNGFSNEQMAVLSQGLTPNRTLYGLHIGGGHDYFINQLGFMERRKEKYFNGQERQMLYDKINGVKPNQQSRLYLKSDKAFTDDLIRSTDVCWICEGWQQVKFEISLNDSVCLHICFMEYAGIQLEKLKLSDKQVIRLMCPPNARLHFVFITSTGEIILSPKYDVVQNHQIIKSLPSKVITEMNCITTIAPQDVINSNYKPRFNVKPRQINKYVNEEPKPSEQNNKHSGFKNLKSTAFGKL